jgi:hypothetical protein
MDRRALLKLAPLGAGALLVPHKTLAQPLVQLEEVTETLQWRSEQVWTTHRWGTVCNILRPKITKEQFDKFIRPVEPWSCQGDNALYVDTQFPIWPSWLMDMCQEIVAALFPGHHVHFMFKDEHQEKDWNIYITYSCHPRGSDSEA